MLIIIIVPILIIIVIIITVIIITVIIIISIIIIIIIIFIIIIVIIILKENYLMFGSLLHAISTHLKNNIYITIYLIKHYNLPTMTVKLTNAGFSFNLQFCSSIKFTLLPLLKLLGDAISGRNGYLKEPEVTFRKLFGEVKFNIVCVFVFIFLLEFVFLFG